MQQVFSGIEKPVVILSRIFGRKYKGMIIKDLHIENYRLFEDFHMEGLAQVNLIAGKNNTGKTALLEALRIWASRGDNSVINNILQSRGQYDRNLKEPHHTLFNRSKANQSGLPIRLLLIEADGNKIIISRGLRDGKTIYALASSKIDLLSDLDISISPDFPLDEAIYVPFSTNNFDITTLWKDVALTPLEEDVIRIMQTIEPSIDRLNIQDDGARVRLTNESQPVHLKNLGEGANRVLILSLALVSAKNKLLLIDEFEAGLHYSVQEQLWDIIFEYAKKWNIQVFATTHSMDTLKAFHYVSGKEIYKDMGKYYRLQKSRKGPIEAIPYTEEGLELALEVNLEPRG